MIPVILLATATILAVASVGVSLFAVWRSQALALMVDARAHTALEQCQASIEALRKGSEGVAAQLNDLQRQPAAGGIPGVPRPGLNLSKRSQVLRMHRNGDPPSQIAAALGLPSQEVDLLLKVHRIVIKNL